MLTAAVVAAAWGPGAGWPTWGHDPQRSGWARDEHAFTPANAGQLGLEWSVRLPIKPLSLNGLTAPIIVERHPPAADAGAAGALVIVAGASNQVFALSAANGALIWRATLPINTRPPAPGMWLCPNNLNATPVADAAHDRLFVVAADGRLNILSLADGRPLAPPVRFVPPYSKMWSLNYSHGVLYTTLSQDCADAHSGVYAINPDEPGRPVTTFWSTGGCDHGGFCGAGIWGRGGAAVDFTGDLLAATGDAPFAPQADEFGDTVLRLTPGRLRLANYFTPPDWNYITDKDLDMGNTGVLVFPLHGRILAAAAGKMGVIYLMDAATPGGPDHHHPLYVTPRLGNDAQSFQRLGIWGAMSSWRDGENRVWLLAPLWGPPAAGADFPVEHGAAPDGSVAAFQVVATSSGGATLRPAWRSRDIAVPDPVAIAGGVVFALGTGENTEQVHNGDIRKIIHDRRARQTSHAVVYALDGETGAELWSSGDTIGDWTHFSGPAVAAGRIVVSTHGGEVFAFGLGGHARPVPPPPPPTPTAAAPPAPPRGASPEAAARAEAGCEEARKSFQEICSVCHGPDGKGYAALHTPNFTDPAWQAAHSNEQLETAVHDGVRGAGYMPAFGNSMSGAQIDALVRCEVRRFAASR